MAKLACIIIFYQVKLSILLCTSDISYLKLLHNLFPLIKSKNDFQWKVFCRENQFRRNVFFARLMGQYGRFEDVQYWEQMHHLEPDYATVNNPSDTTIQSETSTALATEPSQVVNLEIPRHFMEEQVRELAWRTIK